MTGTAVLLLVALAAFFWVFGRSSTPAAARRPWRHMSFAQHVEAVVAGVLLFSAHHERRQGGTAR